MIRFKNSNLANVIHPVTDIDECLCRGNIFLDAECFQCLTNPSYVLASSHLCDGVIDCPDLTDECLCQPQIQPEICKMLIWSDNITRTQEEPYLECMSVHNDTQIKLNATRICDKKVDCLNSEDELYCQIEGIKSKWQGKVKDFECGNENKMATKCDGIPECVEFIEEECNCTIAPEFCVNLTTYGNCTTNNGTDVSFVDGTIMCDGLQRCDNYQDEIGCSSRFYCTDDPIPNIPISKKCDKRDDCPNYKDEENCTYFYCGDSGYLKYISQKSVCDGVPDCQDGADECQSGCVKSAFSDEKDMIANKVVYVMVWILSITSIIGCSTVVIMTAADLLKSRKSSHESGHTRLSKILILNLSISDFLVGVYTVSICVKSVEIHGDYCKVDREWRSSMTCSALGALLVIGSEQSVLTMVLITIQRLQAVVRPFSRPNLRRTIIAISASWLFSIALGLIPMVPQFEDYFVSSIAFTENYLFKLVVRTDKKYMTRWLDLTKLDHHHETTHWGVLKHQISKINPNIRVAYEFGYYSSHTVCLPTFYPNPAVDLSWGYSLFILLINFIAFIFMAVAYIALYRHAVKTEVTVSKCAEKNRHKQNIKIQRKLTRIVMSDFLCWMPVCIMGFLQLGGVNIPSDAYLPTGLLIIPINSALNPLLYSDLLEVIWIKMRSITATIRDRRNRIASSGNSATTEAMSLKECKQTK